MLTKDDLVAAAQGANDPHEVYDHASQKQLAGEIVDAVCRIIIDKTESLRTAEELRRVMGWTDGQG